MSRKFPSEVDLKPFHMKVGRVSIDGRKIRARMGMIARQDNPEVFFTIAEEIGKFTKFDKSRAS